MKTLILTFLVVVLAGCANPLNEATAQRYTTMGTEAVARGDYALAEVAYGRAMNNADWGSLGPHVKAFTLVNLAVAKMYLGKLSEAETILNDAADIQTKSSVEDPKLRFRTEIFLADLYRLRKQWDQGLPHLRRLMGATECYGLTALWDDLCGVYASELRSRGLESEATLLDQQRTMKGPNQALLPTTTAVTPAASHPSRQP